MGMVPEMVIFDYGQTLADEGIMMRSGEPGCVEYGGEKSAGDYGGAASGVCG